MSNLPIDLDAQARQLSADMAVQLNVAALANGGNLTDVTQVVKDAQAIYEFLCPGTNGGGTTPGA